MIQERGYALGFTTYLTQVDSAGRTQVKPKNSRMDNRHGIGWTEYWIIEWSCKIVKSDISIGGPPSAILARYQSRVLTLPTAEPKPVQIIYAIVFNIH